ncbi:MAG: DUF262 domain-containing protein [Candidatus Hydrogenedentes bacterium]|nr:DUF262 domain-containing protein [Candidatus Hydrogenedentota bacterium]
MSAVNVLSRSPHKADGIEQIESEITDSRSDPITYEISTYPADFTLEVLWQKWKEKKITIPSFQRQYVWKPDQASKLIESFLLGLPVPSIFLYTERRSERLLVIDGQQRLKSIFYFFEGYFGEEIKGRRPIFRLVGLNEQSPWLGKTFADLKVADEASANRLLNAVLRAFVVKQLDPKDDTSIFHIFERLNTGGTLLKGQEVRNCVYDGTFNNLLKRLNESAEWRQVFGKRNLDTRMRDVELILRFLALSCDLDDYSKPMTDFLSHFMSTYKDARDETLERFRVLFEETIHLVLSALGQKPFHIRRGLNAAVCDAVLVALSNSRGKQVASMELRRRYERLKRDENFLMLVTAGTTETETVKERVSRAKSVLLS